MSASTLPLLATFDYTGVANTSSVSAGSALLTGQVDVTGGVYSVASGRLVSNPASGGLKKNLLVYTGYNGLTDQKMVVTGGNGATFRELGWLIRATLSTQIGYAGKAGTNGYTGISTVSGGTAQTDFSYTTPSTAYAGSHQYQAVIEVDALPGTGGAQNMIRIAVFDLANAGVGGQPADPIYYTDAGAIYRQTINDFTGSQIASGSYGIACDDVISISKVRIYGPILTASTDNNGALQTGQGVEAVYLTNYGWTAGSPGSPTFTGAFVAAGGDSGTAPTINSQQVLSPTSAIVWVNTGTAQGNFTISDPATGQSVVVPLTNSAPAIVTTCNVTMKTYLGAAYVPRADGVTDDTVAYQRWLDILARYALCGYQEPGRIKLSAPAVLRKPGDIGAWTGYPRSGMSLKGMIPPASDGSSGAVLWQSATGQRAVIEIGQDVLINTLIEQIGFLGTTDTTRGLFAPCHNWNTFWLKRCTIYSVDRAIDIDNQNTVSPYTHNGGNGEGLRVDDCNLNARYIIYRNASASGQAYGHS